MKDYFLITYKKLFLHIIGTKQTKNIKL